MLRYGVLGLLIERRGYGYQLVQRLSERLGAAWQLNPSAVYGALDQLEDAGLIEVSVGVHCEQPALDRSSRRAARVVYEATDRGVGEFQAWLARPSTRASPIRSEIQLKVALAAPENIPALLDAIAHEEWKIKRRLAEEHQAVSVLVASEERVRGTRAMSLHAGPGEAAVASGWSSAVTALVNAAATTRLQGELAWIEVVRETLQRMIPKHFTSAGRIGGVSGAPTLP